MVKGSGQRGRGPNLFAPGEAAVTSVEPLTLAGEQSGSEQEPGRDPGLNLDPLVSDEIRIELLQVGLDPGDGLGMDLADPRLGQAESLGNFTQAHIFEIIEGQHLPLHFRQLLQAIGDQSCHLAAKSAVQWVLLALVRETLILRK